MRAPITRRRFEPDDFFTAAIRGRVGRCELGAAYDYLAKRQLNLDYKNIRWRELGRQRPQLKSFIERFSGLAAHGNRLLKRQIGAVLFALSADLESNSGRHRLRRFIRLATVRARLTGSKHAI